jgi:glycerol-3-phosphate cytidylyltransferase-like family protein
MGDVLFVGVDSDEMARFRKEDKWPPRPFDPCDERLEIVSFGRPVDFVVLHADLSDLDDTLRIIQPDVFVTSMTTGPEIQNKLNHFLQFAKQVENWPPQASTSTTAKNRKLASEVFAEFRNSAQQAIDEVGQDGDIKHLHQKLQEAFDKLEQKIQS